MRRLAGWAVTLILVVSFGGTVLSQEVGPREVVDVELPILLLGEEEGALPVVAEGSIELIPSCDYCYLHAVQYRVMVPAGVSSLVIELDNTTDPFGDIDLIVREGEPVTEDDSAYYYSYRTYEDAGFERLELPEFEGEEVPSGPLYIAVVSYVEPGQTFEIRAAAFVEERMPERRSVSAATPIEDSLDGRGLSGDLVWQYATDVPEEADRLIIHASAPFGNIDLLVGRHPIQLDDEGRPLAEIQLLGTGPDELLVLEHPAPGTYWFVVGNRGADRVTYQLRAATLPGIVPMAIPSTSACTIGWEELLIPELADELQTRDGLLGLDQYVVEAPESLGSIRVRVAGADAAHLGLHIRFGSPVTTALGQIVADLSVTQGTVKEVVFARALLGSSPLYIAIERRSTQPGEDAFSLVVESGEDG